MTHRAAIGIDIGGTKTLCLLVNDELKVLEEVKFKTAPRHGQKPFTASLTPVLKRLKQTAKAKNLNLVAVGVGCAGSIDEEKRTIKSAPNLRRLEGYAIGRTVHDGVG